MENFGNNALPPKANFSCVASIVTTAPEFISLPVAKLILFQRNYFRQIFNQ
jgi:hypothetical protein